MVADSTNLETSQRPFQNKQRILRRTCERGLTLFGFVGEMPKRYSSPFEALGKRTISASCRFRHGNAEGSWCRAIQCALGLSDPNC